MVSLIDKIHHMNARFSMHHPDKFEMYLVPADVSLDSSKKVWPLEYSQSAHK